MLKNFKNGYAVSGSSEAAIGEKNDCAVRAIANACEVNYEQAHQYCADTFDRKKGKGTKLFNALLKTEKSMSFSEVGQLSLFNSGITRELKHLGDAPKIKDGKNIGGKLINKKYKHKPVAYTVHEFAKANPKGSFILAVKGHALAVKNGEIYDNNTYQKGGYRRVVEAAFSVGF